MTLIHQRLRLGRRPVEGGAASGPAANGTAGEGSAADGMGAVLSSGASMGAVAGRSEGEPSGGVGVMPTTLTGPAPGRTRAGSPVRTACVPRGGAGTLTVVRTRPVARWG